MNKLMNQGTNILKILWSNLRKHISLFVSLCLMLVLSIALISSFFLSDLTFKNLAQSDYFRSKVIQVLAENEITSKGLVSIKFKNYSSADITIEKANLSSSSNVLLHDINLKVDFIKYWLGLTFIDEVFIKEVVYNKPNDLSINLKDLNSIDLKFLTQSMHAPLNKINSKSIYIEKGTLKFQSQLLNFRKIYFFKDETLLTAKASLNFKPNADEITYDAKVTLSLNDANIVKFNIDLYGYDYKHFFSSEKVPEVVRLLFGRLIKNSNLTDKKSNEVKVVGTYDLNSSTLNLELTGISDKFKFNSSIKIPNSLKNNELSFRETELVLGNYSLLASNFNFDFVNRTFETNITKFLMPFEHTSVFSNKFKVFGVFPFGKGVISKINILGENPSNLKASLEIVESTNKLDNEREYLDFFVKVDALRKINLNKFELSLNIFSEGEDKVISLSNADAQIRVELGNKYVKLNSFKGKINNLVHLENNKPSVEFESIDFKGNLKQGYATINKVTKIEPSKNIYRNIEVEFSSTSNEEHDKEITLSFKSSISDLISLATNAKHDLTWISSLVRSQEEKEVAITYSRAITFENIEKFFAPEENMFELNMKNLLIPITTKNSVKLGALNLKGVGNTIFFEGLMAADNKKITGSINNWLFNTLNGHKTGNLIIVFDNLNSHTLFPNFSTFKIKGPMKLTFLPVGKDDNISIKSNVDLTNADVYVPSLALKKVKGKYGQLKFDFTKDNRSLFRYSQKDVLVSGTASHESIFEIKKVNYSHLKTPDIRIEKATFQKFSEYDQFKTNKGTISLEFLMRLSLKKKEVPLDLIFSDIAVIYKKNEFLDSLKGEIRSFNGLRGYAKAKLSKNSGLEIIISPQKNNGINLVVSGNDAGELLRKGKYYENGYGGLFKASVFYNSRTKMSGSLEIEGFRIRNAPVLAQIISSASIIGLLDNLNGNGLLFTKIEGSFDYNDGELTLKDGVAVGPSLGLTMAGYERYGKKQNTVNVNGLVSPVYIINGVVKAIPLIGKVLGGEKGEGVFGVKYKVQGNSSNPRVLVNPLSILTPGVFRKIFNIHEDGNM